MALHHLIDALCQLCGEAIELAYANKVSTRVPFVLFYVFTRRFSFQQLIFMASPERLFI